MLTALLQLSEFMLGSWLLSRFVDWCYRRNLDGPEVAGEVPLSDRDGTLTPVSGAIRPNPVDHGRRAAWDPAHPPGRRSGRREDLRHARGGAPSAVPRYRRRRRVRRESRPTADR